MAVAYQVASDPTTLLSRFPQAGFSVTRQGIVNQVPGDASGNPTIPLQVDAFEWKDVQAFGLGNADDALMKMRAYIQAAGSDLYAYALMERQDINFLGVSVKSYRLVLLHSFVQLLAGAVAILAIAFAAVIFIQYVTTGRAPALQDLQNLWGSAVTSVGTAVGDAAGGIANVYIMATVAAGALAIAIASAGKAAGTKVTPPRLSGPSASVGVRSGPVSARVGS